MAQRLELQALLEGILGSRNVYFQPPPSLAMQYPCIVYRRNTVDIRHADNAPYKHLAQYQVTVISGNPDNDTFPKVMELPMCSYDRSYSADDLHHDVVNLFF